jgi:nucleotide-binding universal stress UspA family protein
MSVDQRALAVVVAVDVRHPAGDAVDWAAAEAAARGVPLQILHALRPRVAVDPYGLYVLADTAPSPETVARQALQQAAARARSVAAELDVSTCLIAGPTVRVLVEASRRAALLVVGRADATGVSSRLTGLLAGQLAARARCPVVAIGPRGSALPGPSRPRVVLGVDVTRCVPATLDFAFSAAAQRGIPLVAVHAWRSDVAADLEGVCSPVAAAEATARDKLGRLLQPWQNRFGGVRVETRLVRDDPTAALLAESEGSALLVVGSTARGPMCSALCGSVSRRTVRRARSPVVVVRPDGPGRTAEPGGRTWLRRRARPGAGLTDPARTDPGPTDPGRSRAGRPDPARPERPPGRTMRWE